MTYEKIVHYIDNNIIVETIKKCNKEQLNNWLKNLNQHLEIEYKNKNIPIQYVAEKELIISRLN